MALGETRVKAGAVEFALRYGNIDGGKPGLPGAD